VRRRGLTIGRLMLGVAGVAVLLVLPWTRLGVVLVVCGMVAAGSGLAGWWLYRRWPGRAGWWFGVSAVLCNVLVAWGGLPDPGVEALVVMTAAALLTLPAMAVAGAAWAASTPVGEVLGKRPGARAWCSVVLLAGLPLSMILFQWPFRLVFLASRPALERLADRVEAGNPPTFPVSTGYYTVHFCAKNDEGVYLFILPRNDNPCHFVRARVEVSHASPFWEYDFRDNRIDLFGRWFYIGHD